MTGLADTSTVCVQFTDAKLQVETNTSYLGLKRYCGLWFCLAKRGKKGALVWLSLVLLLICYETAVKTWAAVRCQKIQPGKQIVNKHGCHKNDKLVALDFHSTEHTTVQHMSPAHRQSWLFKLCVGGEQPWYQDWIPPGPADVLLMLLSFGEKRLCLSAAQRTDVKMITMYRNNPIKLLSAKRKQTLIWSGPWIERIV